MKNELNAKLTLLKIFFLILCISFPFCGKAESLNFSDLDIIPAEYNGRYRPSGVYTRLWLQDLFNHQSISKKLQRELNISSSSELLWKIHFLGYKSFDNAAIFHVQNAGLKKLLSLDENSVNFSFSDLQNATLNNKVTNLELAKFLISYYFLNNIKENSVYNNKKIELNQLYPGFYAQYKNGNIVVLTLPPTGFWNNLNKDMIIYENVQSIAENFLVENKKNAEEAISLLNKLNKFEKIKGSKNYHQEFVQAHTNYISTDYNNDEIQNILNSEYPLAKRLHESDGLFKMLPEKSNTGRWISISVLRTKSYDKKSKNLIHIKNFTFYTDEHFDQIRNAYFKLEESILNNKNSNEIQEKISLFTNLMSESYKSLAGKEYKEVYDKSLYYPNNLQLQVEYFYYKTPLIEITLVLYAIALTLLLLTSSSSSLGVYTLILAFAFHTLILGLRCFILMRAPVSNMLETVIYVPWITVLTSLIFRTFIKNNSILIASSIVACVLLILIKTTNMSHNLENVQAVLDSQYWLIIHVLMVVGSYGAFLLSGILSHLYLLTTFKTQNASPYSTSLAKFNLNTLYLGVALLVPGTILGGIWAAESWGRFWDWDPKESWAFISICVYLIWIHAYRFKHIDNFGLAVGSIVGMLAISFTWYGVNYILGTGLHSYGFGSGGEFFYYLFLLLETLFLLIIFFFRKKNTLLANKNNN